MKNTIELKDGLTVLINWNTGNVTVISLSRQNIELNNIINSGDQTRINNIINHLLGDVLD